MELRIYFYILLIFVANSVKFSASWISYPEEITSIDVMMPNSTDEPGGITTTDIMTPNPTLASEEITSMDVMTQNPTPAPGEITTTDVMTPNPTPAPGGTTTMDVMTPNPTQAPGEITTLDVMTPNPTLALEKITSMDVMTQNPTPAPGGITTTDVMTPNPTPEPGEITTLDVMTPNPTLASEEITSMDIMTPNPTPASGGTTTMDVMTANTTLSSEEITSMDIMTPNPTLASEEITSMDVMTPNPTPAPGGLTTLDVMTPNPTLASDEITSMDVMTQNPTLAPGITTTDVMTPSPTPAPGGMTTTDVMTPNPTQAPGGETTADVMTPNPTPAPGGITTTDVMTPNPTPVPEGITTTDVMTPNPTSVPEGMTTTDVMTPNPTPAPGGITTTHIMTPNPTQAIDEMTTMDIMTPDPTPAPPGTPFPTISSTRLNGPVVEDDLYVMFYCDVNLTTSDHRARVYVTFPYTNAPAQTVSTSPYRAPLHEKYLSGTLPRSIYCRIYTYWSDNPSVSSSPMYSNSYIAGISTSPSYLYLYDTDDSSTTMQLYSSLPVTCTYRDNKGDLQGCELNLEIKSPPGVALFSWDSEEGAITRCQHTFRPEDWREDLKVSHNPLQPLEFQSVREPAAYSRYGYIEMGIHSDDKNDPKLANKVDKDGNSYPNPWHNGRLGYTWVFIYRRYYGKRCVSSGDPRMTTFDYSYYNAPQTGVFILTRSLNKRTFEVHVRHVPCFDTWWSRGYCSITCAVAVREGSVAYGLDACNDNNRMHRLRLSKDRLDYDPITADASRRNWMIKMPSGAFVEVYLFQWRRGMNVYVNVPPADYRKTEGLCGTYDNNRNNDYKLSDGSYVNTDGSYYWYKREDINRFVESWRIKPKDSLFQKPPPPGNKPPSVGQSPNRFCSCDKPKPANVKCGFDALENPVFRLGHPSEPVRSSLPWWMRWNLSQRKKRSTTSNSDDLTDDIDDEYTFIDYGEDSATDEVPTWPTWNNITEEMANSDCEDYLQKSAPYKACTGSIPVEDFNDVVQKCVDDVQLTGDISWADDKVSDLKSLCLQEIVTVYVNSTDNSTNTTEFDEEKLAEVEDITSSLCPNDCTNSSRGNCVGGVCQCLPGYIGGDCSLEQGTAPRVIQQLGLSQCDTRERLCRSVKIQAEDIANTADLSCQVAWSRYNEEQQEFSISEESEGDMVSYNEIECSLPLLNTGNSTNGITLPYYTYTVGVSNDGNTFSDVVYNSSYVVYDSACLACVGDNCTLQDTGCWIEGGCYAACELNPANTIQECNPSLDVNDWSTLGASPCEWSLWSEFTNCTKLCDYGTRERYRECLSEPCEGEDTDKNVCNAVNCPELDGEIPEGVILRVLDSTPEEVALIEEDLLLLTTRLLDEYCVDDKFATCCDGFSQGHSGDYGTNFFNTSQVTTAQGYPRAESVSDTSTDSLIKVLAKMTSFEIQAVCGPLRNHRNKRQAETTTLYMDRAIILEALRPRLEEYINELGIHVAIDEEPSTSGVSVAVIAGSVVGAVLGLLIIGLVVGLLKCKKSAKVTPRSSRANLNHEDTEPVLQDVTDPNNG